MRKDPQEYKFKIDAYTPSSMPLSRLTEYLRDLATIIGEAQNTHLVRIDEGSTVSVLRVDAEAVPKVEHRLMEVDRNIAPANVMQAVRRVNKRLRMDGGSGSIINPNGENVIYFPGAEQESLEYGPLNQVGTLDGVPVMIGGINDPVPVHLEGRRGEPFNCEAARTVAKEIAKCLFFTIIRAEGIGRWLRTVEGDWELEHFKIVDFKPMGLVSELSLRDTLEELRKIPAKWKDLKDPIGEFARLRDVEIDDIEM
jgi:hypothetical protein